MVEDNGSGSVNVLLYIDGEVLEGDDGVQYSKDPKKVIRVCTKSKFKQLHDKICRCLDINTEMFKVRVTCKYPILTSNGRVIFVQLPVVDDEDVCIVLNPQSACPNVHVVQLFLTREPVCANLNDVPLATREPSIEAFRYSREQDGGCCENFDAVPNMDPGPLDRSVLTYQVSHRSQRVWDEQITRELHCRTRMAVIQRKLKLDSRIIPYLQRAGFYGVARVGFMKLDWHLITAFVERWRPETHTFHLSQGEATITLQDVALQLGLPVDGKAVIGPTAADWPALCHELLGVTPPDGIISGSRLQLSYLTDNFQELPPDADDEMVQRHARAYILQLIGGCLFADKSQNLVHLMFLQFLRDFDDAGTYSWGSATLAWLYRELCRATHVTAHEIAGPLILLQLWAWDRCPHIAPLRKGLRQLDLGEDGQPLPPGPLGVRWRDNFCTTMVSQHVLTWYRYELDRQRADQMIWEPYTNELIETLPPYCLDGRDVWCTIVPLMCFHIAEWHRPDRVMRQFGFCQDIPSPCDTRHDPSRPSRDLHDIDLRGRMERDWRGEHASLLQLWDARRNHIVMGEVTRGPMDYHDPYMVWYRSITRRYMTRVGGFFEVLSDVLVQIYDLASLGATSQIQTKCVKALHLIKEQHRLVVAHMDVPLESSQHQPASTGRAPIRASPAQGQDQGRDITTAQTPNVARVSTTTTTALTTLVITPTASTTHTTSASTSHPPPSFPPPTARPSVALLSTATTTAPTASVITPIASTTPTTSAIATSTGPSTCAHVSCVPDDTLSQPQHCVDMGQNITRAEKRVSAAVRGRRRKRGVARGRGTTNGTTPTTSAIPSATEPSTLAGVSRVPDDTSSQPQCDVDVGETITQAEQCVSAPVRGKRKGRERGVGGKRGAARGRGATNVVH